MTPPFLELRSVGKTFLSKGGERVSALRDVTLSIEEQTFVSVIGPSGCGKSTLLKIVAGLLKPSSGIILRSGSSDLPVQDLGIVFQDYNLFPWLTVWKNVEFGLLALGRKLEDRLPIVRHALDAVGLQDFAQAYPRELSGGMQQRVGLARALATNPRVLLMDEPFAALDTQTRRCMQDLLLDIDAKDRRTILFSSHDVDEVILMSDVLYVLSPRPGTITHRIIIDLPRPRHRSMEFSDRFLALKKIVQGIVTEESVVHA